MGVCGHNYHVFLFASASFDLFQVLLKEIRKIKGKDSLLWGDISSVEASCHEQLLLLGNGPKQQEMLKHTKLPGRNCLSVFYRVVSWDVHTRPIRRNCKSEHPGILQVVENSILTSQGHRQRYIKTGTGSPERWYVPHPLKTFQARLDRALNNLIGLKMYLLIAVGLD